MKLTKKQLDELTGGGKTPKDVESLYSQMLQHMIMAVECECAGDRRSRCLRPDYRKLAGQSLVVSRESSHSSVMEGGAIGSGTQYRPLAWTYSPGWIDAAEPTSVIKSLFPDCER